METLVKTFWTKSKLLVKAGIIGLLVLVLQIPAVYVKDLILEREARQREAVAEVSSKWAGRQTVTGPVLAVPYWEAVGSDSLSRHRVKKLAYFLPDELKVNAAVSPQEKHRGLYTVMLYSASVQLAGAFRTIDVQRLDIASEDLIWPEAYLRLSTSDNKGLNDEVKLVVNDTTLTVSPFDGEDGEEGLYTRLPLASADEARRLNFSSRISLNGSESLQFVPAAKTTTVVLQSAWPHPRFNGNALPQTTAVNNKGFSATWRSLGHRQSFPQQWKGDAVKASSLTAAAFGVDLFVPVNSYQKILRSVKYSFLCLLLTFAAFFLVETTAKKSAHPFHYGLIGLALILFYTLLLSFSEYIGFNAAYALATLFTVGLIAWFARGILASGRMAVLMATVMVLLYGYVFTLLQLQDYSLLLGSLGLFATLAVAMHFSKKIQW